MQPKHQNGNLFVDIEGFRSCLSEPSYRTPKLALMVRLMQKERLESPQKLLIRENPAFWDLGYFGHYFGQNFHFGHFGQPFPNQGGHAEKKCHLRPCLHQPDQATFGFGGVYTHRKPDTIFYCRGCEHGDCAGSGRWKGAVKSGVAGNGRVVRVYYGG